MRTLFLRIVSLVLFVLAMILLSGCLGDGDSSISTISTRNNTRNETIVNNPDPVPSTVVIPFHLPVPPVVVVPIPVPTPPVVVIPVSPTPTSTIPPIVENPTPVIPDVPVPITPVIPADPPPITPTNPVNPDPVTPTSPVDPGPVVPTIGTVHFIETDGATYVSDTAVTLNGRLSVLWASSAEYAYFHIRQQGYGWGPELSVGMPSAYSVQMALAGLAPNTDYDFQLVVRTGVNSRTFGGIRSFRTLALPPVVSGNPIPTTSSVPNPDPVTSTNPTTPTSGGPVVTGNVTNVGSNSATLNGSVSGISWANGGAAYFLVSPNKQQPWVTQDAGQPVGNVTTTVANLTPDTDYWARLITITSSVANQPKGEWVVFRTLASGQAGMTPTFQPSTKALSSRSMPVFNQADGQTRGYVNLTMDGVTLLGYVYCNSERFVNVWFQTSTDGENWNNYYVGVWEKDGAVKYTLYGLSSGTAYKYRIAVASFEERLRYGEDLKFTTLISSEHRDSYISFAGSYTENMRSSAETVKSMCDGSYMGDDGFVSSVSDEMDRANDSEYFAWVFLSSPELSDAVLADTASNFINADKVLTEARTQFSTLCERASNASGNVGSPAIQPPQPVIVYKTTPVPATKEIFRKAEDLSGKDITFATSQGPEAIETPNNHTSQSYIDNGYVYRKVVNALIDGIESSRQIVNHIRWNSDISDYWSARYVTNLTFRSYLAVIVVNQFITLPEVKRCLDTDTKVRLERMRDEMKNFRADMRGFEDDCLSARQKQSRAYQCILMRYVTGTKSYPEEGLGKSGK